MNPASQDSVSVAARNLQFQLWLTSWFAAGDKTVRYEEPDLKVVYWFKWNGVAAKRIQSPSSILKNAKNAANQVRTRVGRGFIALGFDNYSPALRKRFTGLRNPKRFFERLPELVTAIQWCRDNAPWIRAVLVFGAMAQWRLRLHPARLLLSFPEQVWCIPRDQCDRANLDDFFKELHNNYRKNVSVL